ncbi:MAG: hypothetical protein CVV64_07070 [Candidatus Wallbacteria bacterium HGW-Wallbacteria-1]|jgi:subtilisin family serine protease|uniref:Peptidase S8/S53 domain-containing protein n=1 Tax=Candidatus Wallbacteria bacterium HGW-Wallbacteria-1 TaxID=2013854 RepID=A0A2N1PT54_9BACT|nr:MAG: hypothetical protein CVV64_07070 [Candidatus Wallbacteria bacterium HGW-Wallbacteria-1]
MVIRNSDPGATTRPGIDLPARCGHRANPLLNITLLLSMMAAFLHCGQALALNPKLDRNLFHVSSTISRNVVFSPKVSGERVAVLIQSDGNNDTLVSKIRARGGIVHSTTGNILTARVPLSAMDELASYPEVTYVQGDHLLFPLLDLSKADTNVDDVQLGTDLPRSYDGKGVLIGIVDTGIDFRHQDFIDENGKTKILYIWDTTDDGGPAPKEISEPYGSEYTADDINDEIDGSPTNLVRERDTNGHGTHVAGMAASFGRAQGNYKGVAPGAELIIVKGGNGSFRTSDVMNGIDYLVKKATALGRPIVINLSLGGHSGPHDGTHLEEAKIDSLSGPGRVFTIAAGNEGNDLIHCGYWTASTEQDTQFKIYQSLDSSGRDISSGLIDLWYSTGSIEFKLQAFDVNTGFLIDETVWIKHGDEAKGITINDATQTYGRVDVWAGTSALNNQRNVYFIAYQENGDSGIHGRKVFWKLKTRGSGNFDGWINGGLFLVHDPVVPTDGNNDSSVGMPGTASQAITVANYTTRAQWVDVDGNSQSWSTEMKVGHIATSSSKGPTRNPSFTGQKPEIAAPGSMIIAPLSADVANPSRKYMISTNVHRVMNGTSMASPFVAGVIALMLQKNKDLTPQKIETYLTQNATVDAITGNSLPNPIWGYGKVDALKTIKATPAGTPPVTPPYGTIKFTSDPQSLEAETGTTATITSDPIHDANDNLVPDGTLFTLILYGSGEIITPDADGDYPGIQLASADGKVKFEYKAPSLPEKVVMYVSSNDGEADGKIEVPVYTKGAMGNKDPAPGDGGLDRCFIANAAYGTPMASEIRYLCNLRDQYLMPTLPGRIFVKTYYTLSPPVAKFIGKSETLRAITRFLLIPLVSGARTIVQGDHDHGTMLLLFYLSGGILSGAVIYRRWGKIQPTRKFQNELA